MSATGGIPRLRVLGTSYSKEELVVSYIFRPQGLTPDQGAGFKKTMISLASIPKKRPTSSHPHHLHPKVRQQTCLSLSNLTSKYTCPDPRGSPFHITLETDHTLNPMSAFFPSELH